MGPLSIVAVIRGHSLSAQTIYITCRHSTRGRGRTEAARREDTDLQTSEKMCLKVPFEHGQGGWVFDGGAEEVCSRQRDQRQSMVSTSVGGMGVALVVNGQQICRGYGCRIGSQWSAHL